MDDDLQVPSIPAKRFPLLLFVSFIAGLVAEPHGNYDLTAAGIWSPIILAIVPAIVVALIVWIIIRRSNPSHFTILSYPMASAITAIGAFFFWLRRDHLIDGGLNENQATMLVLLSPTGLTLALGLVLLGFIMFRKNRENIDA